jgi:hypothetical protein
MPIKSVFAKEIGEGVDKFKDFEKAFDRYREKLGKMPSAWASMSKSNKEAEDSFKSMAAALMAQAETLNKEAQAVGVIEQSAKRTSLHWKDISSSARSFYGHLSSIASTVRNSALVGGFLGLLGLGGGLYGLDRLGASAGAGRRLSTGLGLGYGDMSAFGLTYGRVIDPSGFLGAVSQGRGNIGGSEASALMALGISPGSGDTGGVARQALRRVWEMARSTPEHLLGPVLQEGYGVGSLGFSIEDLRRLRGMSSSEFEKYSGQMSDRSKGLNVDDETLRRWQDFVNNLDVAGKKMETSFIRGLVRLTDPLNKLSEEAVKLVDRFFGSKSVEWAMGKLTDWMNDFATYIADGSFKKDLIDLKDGLAGFAQFLKRWFGPSGPTTATGGVVSYDEYRKQFFDNPLRRGREGDPSAERVLKENYEEYLKQHGIQSSLVTNTNGPGQDLLATVARLENSGDRAISPMGAIGKYQIMPGTAAAYGVKAGELLDPATNEATARKILDELSARYKGNTAAILAAYNAGPQIGDYLDKNPGRIPSHYRKQDGTMAPYNYKETQDYLARAGIRVTIDNPAGASVVTQADQLGGSYPAVVP